METNKTLKLKTKESVVMKKMIGNRGMLKMKSAVWAGVLSVMAVSSVSAEESSEFSISDSVAALKSLEKVVEGFREDSGEGRGSLGKEMSAAEKIELGLDDEMRKVGQEYEEMTSEERREWDLLVGSHFRSFWPYLTREEKEKMGEITTKALERRLQHWLEMGRG